MESFSDLKRLVVQMAKTISVQGFLLCMFISIGQNGFAQVSRESNGGPLTTGIEAKGIIGEEDNELNRLIVNETITKAGNDFQDLFFNQWVWPDSTNNETFILVIKEQPYRGISSQISIAINDLVVFESFLQSRYEYIEYLAEAAIQQVQEYILNYEDILRQLEGEDVKGTGIH